MLQREYFLQLKYVDTKEEIMVVNKKSKHIEPHLHNALLNCLHNRWDIRLECQAGTLPYEKRRDISLYFQILFITIRY